MGDYFMIKYPINLIFPKEIKIINLKNNHYQIIIEPFERGFGHTIGNAIRRILISSIPGSAIVSTKIEGVEHEFSSISGVQEDVMNILLNLKEIAIKMYGDEESEIIIYKEGPNILTANDIIIPKNIEIINKEHIIAHINDGGKININMLVKQGKGYDPAYTRIEKSNKGEIKLDASFSPIIRVYYYIESYNLPNNTEKLIIELETNGTISAEEAMQYSAIILQKQLDVIVNLTKSDNSFKKVENDERKDILLQPIEYIKKLNRKQINLLKSENIYYIGDIVQRNEKNLLNIRQFGIKSLKNIKIFIESHGLKLGMEIKTLKSILFNNIN
ncbi:DNA-directed RNA polymerase subunit alpha [Candidatus Johnevansia muelleri]|uniref:DNA-directed RNA polymerase subunit alpha n=1 Tax=Candidatus Johnevansia muelleri TaxID=1495769 RepID=A0A078KEE1_9GAMM|nr:DNA-directed RNA polymerase subunit alpha [Candidatus Evansia muelleri]